MPRWKYTHIRIYPDAQIHNLLSLNQAPKKYDLPPCSANAHKQQHRDQAYISVARADKGQAGSSQSAPGSLLIKEQVAAPSKHPGMD